MKYELGQAKREQLTEIAGVFRRSRYELLSFLPELHTLDEDIAFFKSEVWPKNNVWLALDKEKIVGFIAFDNEHISHLYILPEYVGKGIGKALLDKCKDAVNRLELWVFKDNQRAISFYRENGFTIAHETDGQMNEEKLPDLFMVWSREPQV